uniref:G_PROTEIN_RECEP_F2_4 domain-containing protein n=1 Tax=Haemonchus contortus TaxID=6289 RepID=A0A7I4YX42_HAECO
MVHGNSKKNGSAFPVLNYILPILIALIPTLVTYFVMKNYYAMSGRFCFSTAPGDMFWAFVIPNWILIFLAGLQSQLACLACDKTTAVQDQQQCFWAKKSAKSLLMFALLLFTLWLLVLFAGNEQTCEKWSGKSAFYRLCPKKEEPEPIPANQKEDIDLPTSETPDLNHDEEAAPIPDKKPPTPVPEPLAVPFVPESKDQPGRTESSYFYAWLTSSDRSKRASEILFRPKIA